MGLAYEDDLVDDYAVSATDAAADAGVVRKNKGSSSGRVLIPAFVFAYGCNDDFIIAKQHPHDPDDDHRIDTNTTHWYILEVEEGKVHGPLSEDEFGQQRSELNVPPALSFTKTVSGSY